MCIYTYIEEAGKTLEKKLKEHSAVKKIDMKEEAKNEIQTYSSIYHVKTNLTKWKSQVARHLYSDF